MKLMLHVVETKAGYAIQNLKTMGIVSIHKTKEEAERIMKKLTQ